MLSFDHLTDMCIRDGCLCTCFSIDTGEIWQSDKMKNIFNAIKSSRHWEYTCKYYPWLAEGNEHTTKHLFYKIATASGVHYLAWFNVVNGIIKSKGFKCINRRHLESVMYRNAYCYFTRT